MKTNRFKKTKSPWDNLLVFTWYRIYCLRILGLMVLLVGGLMSYAQENIVSAGGDAGGSGGEFSFSIGQVVFESHQGADGSEWQGVQQPYEISVATGSEALENIQLRISAFPNPATSFLILKIEQLSLRHLSWQLFDSQGKILRQAPVLDRENRIEVEQLTPATYLLRVLQDNREITLFKIIKR